MSTPLLSTKFSIRDALQLLDRLQRAAEAGGRMGSAIESYLQALSTVFARAQVYAYEIGMSALGVMARHC